MVPYARYHSRACVFRLARIRSLQNATVIPPLNVRALLRSEGELMVKRLDTARSAADMRFR